MIDIIDSTDARLLEFIQREFPLVPTPFNEIAGTLGLSAPDVIDRISRLKSTGIIRQISAIFNSAALGYKSTLVAFRVRPERLDEIAAAVSAHCGVSHCYSRDAEYNLWFTLTVEPGIDLHREVCLLADSDAIESVLVLPSLRVYKIGIFLGISESSSCSERSDCFSSDKQQGNYAQHMESAADLTELDRSAVRALQCDLPLVIEPFHHLAKAEDLSAEDLLGRAHSFLERGIMRRFAAVLRHQRAGYRYNAMICWCIPEAKIDEIGCYFAAEPAVSHCYQRPIASDWKYSLYTMIHARSESELQEIIMRLATLSNTMDYCVLRTLKEYKKTRISYFVPKREQCN